MKLQHLLVYLFTLAFISHKAYAQTLDFGVKLGANFATLGDLEQFDNEIGFTGGAFLDIKFEKFGIQPELLYSQQGEQFDIAAFDFDYINLPIIFKFYLVGGLNFQLGPQFGVLINDNIPNDIIDSFENETFDIAGVTGLGLDLPLKLRLSARYVFDIENDFQSANFDNGFFMLTLGVGLF
jgi:hypothetical protein